MKEYTVKEVAELLDTNEETVRRWIRQDKLNATRQVGRGGNKVSEKDLEEFLKKSAKYSGVVATTMAATILGPGALAIGGVAMTIPKLAEKLKESDEIQIPKEYVPKIKEAIASCEKIIDENEAKVGALKEEINRNKSLIKKYKYLLSKIQK